MYPLKSVLIATLVLLSAFTAQFNKPQITKWVILKGGALKVNGSTNINKFNCEITSYSNPDTVVIYRKPGDETIPVKGSLVLDIDNFDCHNPVMTSDLRKTLKAKTNPRLVVKFLDLQKYPQLTDGAEVIQGTVAIEMAGVSRRFCVDYKFQSLGDNVITLHASRQVNFSDFNIVPPRKIGGMIQTDNQLSVAFNLHIKVIN